MSDRVVITAITRVNESGASTDQDLVAAEAPLEILLTQGRERTHSLGLVMRTPGDDEDLVMGLLVNEQIVTSPDQVRGMTFEAETGPDADAADAHPARARVTLADSIDLAALAPSRALDRTSACGMCGRLSMQALQSRGGRRPDEPAIDAGVIEGIPARLRRAQPVFAETGGLHAAALCTLEGHPWIVREDVGRHNAVDKIAGYMFLNGIAPDDKIFYTTGRLTSEMVIKTVKMRIPVLVSRSGFTAWGVELARKAGLTLIGRARGKRFVALSGLERIVFDADPAQAADEDKKHVRKGSHAEALE
jgi:FdhD protein